MKGDMVLDTKKCQYCGESIASTSQRCPFCGSILEADSGESKPAFTQADSQQIAEPENNAEQRPEFKPEYRPEVAGSYGTGNQMNSVEPLGNAMKVFLVSLSSIIPGFGQIIGIIVALVLMNSPHDPDRRSFGKALLVASILIFVFSCLLCFAAVIIASMYQQPRFR